MTKILLTTLATSVAALPRGKMLQGAAPHSVKVEAVPEVVKVAETNLNNKNNDDFVHTIQETLHNVIAENELDDESGWIKISWRKISGTWILDFGRRYRHFTWFFCQNWLDFSK